MADAIHIAANQLKQFENNKRIIEIVTRDAKKRIKSIQKVIIDDLQQNETKELAEKALAALNKNNALNEKNLKKLKHIAKIQNFSFALNCLNLCATCVGFAVMYAKLDSMSKEINQQFSQLQGTIKKEADIHYESEFNKVLANYQDMLDCRRKQKPYSEEKMRELIDDEFNVLTMLISILQKDIASDLNVTITSIFSLLSMFTQSLEYFDQQYYFNNYEILKNDDVWHSSHSKWMGIYDTLSSNWFVEQIQDYAIFNTRLSTDMIDQYYIELIDTVVASRKEVEDNQELIQIIKDPTGLNEVYKATEEQLKLEIESCLKDCFKSDDSQEYKETENYILKQACLA